MHEFWDFGVWGYIHGHGLGWWLLGLSAVAVLLAVMLTRRGAGFEATVSLRREDLMSEVYAALGRSSRRWRSTSPRPGCIDARCWGALDPGLVVLFFCLFVFALMPVLVFLVVYVAAPSTIEVTTTGTAGPGQAVHVKGRGGLGRSVTRKLHQRLAGREVVLT